MIRPGVLLSLLASVLQPSTGKTSVGPALSRDNVPGQTCDGTETFEKVTGVRLLGASEVLLEGGSSGRTVTAVCNNR